MILLRTTLNYGVNCGKLNTFKYILLQYCCFYTEIAYKGNITPVIYIRLQMYNCFGQNGNAFCNLTQLFLNLNEKY